jgi:hypothetical protein
MKRKFLWLAVFALCVSLLLCMGVSASAGGIPDAKYVITISPPADGQTAPAFVTVKVEDVNGTGFTQAAAKLGEDGSWSDLTESLRASGWAQFEIDRNGKVYVAVTDRDGNAHIASMDVDCFGGTLPAAPVQPEAPVTTEPVIQPEAPKAPAVSEGPDDSTVTPTDGSGTVTENSVKAPGEREFFTIQSEKGNDYYIVVDKEKNGQNVYLLSEVTEDDLLGLTKPQQTPQPEPKPVAPAPEPVTPEPEAPPAPEKESNNGMIAVIVLVMLAAGGAGYYFKIVRPKQNAIPDDDYAEDEGDELDDYDYETEDEKEESGE